VSFQYDYPDDPAVFERVMEHFRQTNVEYWEARIAHYASEAKRQSSAPEQATSNSNTSRKKSSRKTIATVKHV